MLTSLPEFLELEHLHSTMSCIFITLAFHFHYCAAFTRILVEITIASRCHVLRLTMEHMYHGNFVHMPWNDSHLFWNSLLVLDRVSKEPNSWRVPGHSESRSSNHPHSRPRSASIVDIWSNSLTHWRPSFAVTPPFASSPQSTSVFVRTPL